MQLQDYIRTIADFPKPGIMYRDITTLLQSPEALSHVIEQFRLRYEAAEIDYVIGIESRGFIFGTALAHTLGVGFIPIRKPGKLPADHYSVSYQLEYGEDSLEIHKDAIEAGARVLVVDDLLATGGTANAAAELLQNFNCELHEFAFVIELSELAGRDRLAEFSESYSLLQY